jgi:hypothetical protein
MEKKLYREELTQMEINAHRASLNGEPAVYCGTYGKYNNGDISGMWVDVASFTDYEEFMEFCIFILLYHIFSKIAIFSAAF